MSDNLKTLKSLQFYQDNDLNEVYGSKDDLELQKKLKLTINSNSKKTTPKKSHLEKLTPAIVEDSVKEKIIEVESQKIPNILPPIILNTDQAISKLANLEKKPQEKTNSEKFEAINDIISKAKKLADSAKTIDELKKIVENFDGCNLKKMATNTVFSDGNPDSEIMVIGEAPGNNEDLQGIPFCGDSGILLNEMLNAVNLTRKKDFYITNVIFWRPPGNRRPSEEELAICRPFVEKHIQLFAPKVIILVGATAMSAILGINEPITKIRGRFLDYKPDFLSKNTKTFTIFHPSFLMRQPAKKKVAWQDMLSLENFVKNNFYEQ